MLAVPATTLLVGVKVAVRKSPVPLMLPKVPPLTMTSPALADHTKLLPGSSLKVKEMTAVSPAFSVATSLVMLSEGAVVSTKYFELSATATEEMTLLLPAASFNVAPFSVRALSAMATLSVSVCPLPMVVVNTKALVPEPDTYVACTVLLPMTNAKVGEPAVVTTVTASVNVTVALSVSVALSNLTVASPGLATDPVALVNARLLTLGARVSTVKVVKLPALPLLSAASW